MQPPYELHLQHSASLFVISLFFSYLFCCTCLYAICRDDEVCSSTDELANASFVNAGDELQLDSVDVDVEHELENNENNSTSSGIFIIILYLLKRNNLNLSVTA